MAKIHGTIGYSVDDMSRETSPGVWTEQIVEREFYGDLIRRSYRLQPPGDRVNDDITIENQISIVADTFAKGHINCMRYICYLGIKWKISNVELQFPRLVLSLGGVYNGPDTTTTTPGEDPGLE